MNIPQDKKRIYIFLVVLNVATAFGFQGWRTLYNNFAVEVGHITGFDMGLLQSVREIPGLLILLAVYVMLLVREHRLAAFSVLVMGAGIGLTGFFPSLPGLLTTTLIFSIGFHFFETVNQSLTLQFFDKATSPLVFGRLKGLQSGANLLVGALIFCLAGVFDYPALFLILGIVVCLAGLWALTKDPTPKETVPQNKGMIFRKRYWLFYALTFFAGARRQIFTAFALFLMVDHFGFTVREITVLFVVNNIINWYLSPLVGKAIVKYGERRMLSLEYAVLILVFLSYAYTDSKVVVIGLYILDHMVFGFTIGIRTFFQKICDPAHIAPSMAMGFSINHISAVIIPVLGGWLWTLDYRIPFIGGAVLAGCSLILSQMIRIPDQDNPEPEKVGARAA